MLGGRRPMGHVHSTRERGSDASGAHTRIKDFKRVTRDTLFYFGIVQLGFKHVAKLVSKCLALDSFEDLKSEVLSFDSFFWCEKEEKFEEER
ncbi:hypothetical protein PanWU01x14_195930 [Parasponia andersonii]|uniref:Uncharacterized protein n=1 Tax=Parasponia andersonii TaxID=3476 RepID=A0A2P5C005_PARAD|nr:hypothetical protein PanWU01x14_195930 [Parasponia andersonii]